MNSHPNKKRHWKLILILTSVLLTLAIIGMAVWSFANRISVTVTVVNSDSLSDITIVFLSDLHNAVLGKNNHRLIKKIQKIDPDLIFVVGDLINSYDNDLTVVRNFLKKAAALAPVYCSYGNHEYDYEGRTGTDLGTVFAESGATVLKETFTDIEIKNHQLRIGGVYGYCAPERYQLDNAEEIAFLREFEATERYKILLDHLPYSWSHYGFTSDYEIDLICSGHMHGGQVIIPVIGGLFEQEFGWFPGKLYGRFDSHDTAVIVSRGISSPKEILPRINNPPEIVVIKGK